MWSFLSLHQLWNKIVSTDGLCLKALLHSCSVGTFWVYSKWKKKVSYKLMRQTIKIKINYNLLFSKEGCLGLKTMYHKNVLALRLLDCIASKVIKFFHLSIHFLYHKGLWGDGAYQSRTSLFTPSSNIKLPINLRFMFLVCERKPKYLEKTDVWIKRTFKQRIQPGYDPKISLLWW